MHFFGKSAQVHSPSPAAFLVDRRASSAVADAAFCSLLACSLRMCSVTGMHSEDALHCCSVQGCSCFNSIDMYMPARQHAICETISHWQGCRNVLGAMTAFVTERTHQIQRLQTMHAAANRCRNNLHGIKSGPAGTQLRWKMWAIQSSMIWTLTRQC
jgi:hypothetical protein